MNQIKLIYIYIQIQILNSVTNCYPSGLQSQATAIQTPFAQLDDAVAEKIHTILNSKALHAVPPFPDSGRKEAVREQESFVSQLDTKYGRLQEFVAGFYNPKPVVDTIDEHEKYGNDGTHSRAIATSLIGKVEGASNVLNTIVDLPFTAGRLVGKKITATLNEVGGQLVGI